MKSCVILVVVVVVVVGILQAEAGGDGERNCRPGQNGCGARTSPIPPNPEDKHEGHDEVKPPEGACIPRFASCTHDHGPLCCDEHVHCIRYEEKSQELRKCLGRDKELERQV